MATDLDLIQEVRIEATTVGINEAVAATSKLGAATDDLTVKVSKNNAIRISAVGDLDRILKKHDAEYRALSELAKVNSALDRARTQGLSASEAFGRVQEIVTNKLRAQAEAANVATQAQNRLAAAARAQAQINGVTGVRDAVDYAARAADIAAYGVELDRLRAKFVPLFAIEQRYKEQQVEIADAQKMGAISANEAAAAQLRLTRAYDDQTSKLQNLARAQKEAVQKSVNQQTIVPDRAGDVAAYAKSMDDLRSKFDPLYRAQRAYRVELAELQGAYRTGAIPSQEIYAAALDRLKTSFAEQVRGLNGVKTAQETVAVSAVKTAAQVRESWASLGGMGASTLANIQAGSKLGSLSNTTGTVADDAAQDRARAKYDEVFAAAQRYRTGLAELRSDLATGAISEQLYTDTLARRKAAFAEQINTLGNYSRAQREAAAAAEASARAEQDAAGKARAQGMVNSRTINPDRAADVKAYAEALDAERAALVPLFAANQQYEAQIQRINTAFRTGAIPSQKEHAAAIATARSTLLNQTNEIRKAEEANARLTKGVGLNAYAWQNLSFQVNDVVTSLASGISPFQTLAQQGGQIYQILQSGQGGVGGALSAIKDRLLAISPLVGVFGGLAAGAVLAAVAAYKFVAAQRDVELALLGAGRGAGLTGDQIQSIAEKASRTSEITVSGAREIEKAFLQTGRVYGEVFATGITAAENFSKTINGDRGKAGEFLAAGLSNLGAGGYEELAKKAGNFDAKLEEQVRTLLNAGKEMEAQLLVTDRFGQAFDKAGEKLTGLQKTLAGADQYVKNLAESFGKAIATMGQPLPVAEKLERVEAAIKTRRTVAPDADISDLTAQADKYRVAIKQVGEETRKEAVKVRENNDLLNKGATNALVTQIAQIEQVRAQKKQANAEANALENSGGSVERIEAAKAAVARASQVERDYAVAGGAANVERVKAVEVMRAGLKAQQAVTPEEKAAAARQVVLADSFATTTSSQERTAKANDAYKKSLAEAKIASDNSSRSMNESTKTANEIASATVKAGKSIEYLSAARKVDEQIANGAIDAKDRDKKITEQLSSQLSGVNQQAAERTRSIQQQATVQESLNDKVAANKMVAADAQRQATLANDVARLTIERDAASGEQKAILTQRIGELTAATQAQFSAEDRLKVLGLGEEEQRRIDLLQKEISLQGESVEVRARELALMQAKQGLERQGISTTAPESVSYLNKVALRTDLDTAKTQYERLAADISGVVSGIFDDMFSKGNKGIAGFADSFSKGFARIGSRMIEQNLIAPLLGGNGGVAGGANGFGSLFKMFDSDKIEKAVSNGASTGISGSFGELLKPKAGGGFATSKLGGGLISAGAGAAIGYQSQSPLMGTIGGGLAGFAAGGPVGAIIGAGAGLLGGLFGKSQAEKERQAKIKEQARQDAETYKAALPQINMLSRTFRGEGTGSVTEQTESAFQQMYQANVTASKGGDQARANELVKEFEGYRERLRMGFMSSFQGIYAEVSKGLGMGGPFAQAATAVMQLGESLKGFVADTKNILNDEGFTRGAQAAARESALASLETPKTLSTIETEFGRINGTASGLKRVLMDLGLSAEDAATAISERTTKAMDALRDKFNSDLDAKINDNTGKGYLNDAKDFLKEIRTLSADRETTGGDANKLEAYFASGAQKIVNDASLTGAAFEEFARLFPEFQGRIKEFSETLVTASEDIAAAAAALAERQRGYQDRVFAASNDASTEAGALAAFERSAAQERLEETKLGGKAMADLESALGAERLKIVRDFAAEAVKAAEEAAAEQARIAEDAARRRLGFEDRLFSTSNSNATQAGALALFDRQAGQQREEEIKAGGQAIAALESALAAERLGIITDFAQKAVDAAKQAAEEQAAAVEAVRSRLRGYGDRLFAAGNDSSSLAGQLVAFDRQAQRDREQELLAGNQAVVELEAALYAERANIIRDFNKQAAEAEKQRMDAAIEAYQNFAKSIKEFVDQMRVGANSPLAPKDRLTEAQRQYDEQLLLARQGNRDALNGITGYASTLLDASKGYNASSPAFQATFEQIAAQLTLLPKQVSAEQFIVDAITSTGGAIVDATEAMQTSLRLAVQANSPQALAIALDSNFVRLDTSVNGLLDQGEFLAGLGPLATQSEQSAARVLFNSIDSNGDGQIDKLEIANQKAQQVSDALSLANQSLAVSARQLNLLSEVSLQNESLYRLTVQVLNSLQVLNTISGTESGNYALLAKILGNVYFANIKSGAQAVFAKGGWVDGPGTGTSDSISARLSNGEFVVNAASARMFAPMLDGMNEGRLTMPTVPVMMNSGNDNSAILAMMQRQIDILSDQNALLRKQIETTAAGARHVGEKVDNHAAETKRGNTDTRQASNRPRSAGTRAA